MKIKQLSEVIYKVYSNGRAKSTAQRLRENDILQMVILAYGNLLRQRWYESKKMDDWGEADYSFSSHILDIKEFELTDANPTSMRRADMKDFDLFRLPSNGHITNAYPIGSCEGEKMGTITQVKPGEENFYLQPKFNFFKFFVVKGRGINTYNLPDCVKKIGVETTYNTDDVDVTLDIGYEIALAVMNLLFKEKQFPVPVVDNSFDANAVQLKRSLEQQ